MDGKPIILCVDDERTVLVSLKEQLRRGFGRDFLIETADDGASALELIDELVAERRDIPLVVSDHIMPGLKGDEFLAKVIGKMPATRTVMLTGQASADAIGRAVNQARLYRFLGKPWSEADLVLTVRSAVESWLVDDERMVLDSLKNQLRSLFGSAFGYETAENVDEAWEILDELAADEVNIVLIVSDWLMPDVRGDVFLTQVREKFPATARVMLTGQADPAAIARARDEAQVLRVLHKPWSEADLRNVVLRSTKTFPPRE